MIKMISARQVVQTSPHLLTGFSHVGQPIKVIQNQVVISPTRPGSGNSNAPVKNAFKGMWLKPPLPRGPLT
jgi:hypothetical protein